MTLSPRDLERLRAVIERGDSLPAGRGAHESALVAGADAIPLDPPVVEPEAEEPPPRETIYDRLRRARPIQPHRLDPAPWTQPEPGDDAREPPPEAEEAETFGPVDYAARAAAASHLHEPKSEPPEAPAPAPSSPPRTLPSTEQLVRARELAKAARQGTRGPGPLGPGGPRNGPYKQLV